MRLRLRLRVRVRVWPVDGTPRVGARAGVARVREDVVGAAGPVPKREVRRHVLARAPIDLRVAPRAMEVPRGHVKVVRAAVVRVRVSVKVRVRVRVEVEGELNFLPGVGVFR